MQVASSERVSLVLNASVAPLEASNVEPVAVTAATLNVPLCASTWLPDCPVIGIWIVLLPVPPLFLIVPALVIAIVPSEPLWKTPPPSLRKFIVPLFVTCAPFCM